MRVLLALHRVGPYHHVRFEAASRSLELQVLETRPQSAEYPWQFHPQAAYAINQLRGQLHPEDDHPLPYLRCQLHALLGEVQT